MAKNHGWFKTSEVFRKFCVGLSYFASFSSVSHCWVSCQWAVSKLNFIMKVINGNCLSYSWGNLLITGRWEYHRGSAGQWLIMDHHNDQQRTPLCTQHFSVLSFPIYKEQKALERAAELKLFLADIQEKGKRRFRNPQSPFYSSSLQLIKRRNIFPTSLSAGENLGENQMGMWLPPGQKSICHQSFCSKLGSNRLTSTFNNGWNKVLIIFHQSPDSKDVVFQAKNSSIWLEKIPVTDLAIHCLNCTELLWHVKYLAWTNSFYRNN